MTRQPVSPFQYLATLIGMDKNQGSICTSPFPRSSSLISDPVDTAAVWTFDSGAFEFRGHL